MNSKLPVAMAFTVLLSTYVVRVQVMWRQALITAAIVIAVGMTHHSELTALEIGTRRVGEVLLGCLWALGFPGSCLSFDRCRKQLHRWPTQAAARASLRSCEKIIHKSCPPPPQEKQTPLGQFLSIRPVTFLRMILCVTKRFPPPPPSHSSPPLCIPRT